jgi:carboxypeptidase Taq
LNKVWNEKYKKYLGITPPTDTLGILQDIHWSDGSFGYFPAYALGSAMAAQWINTMRKKINVNNLLSSGKFIEIKKWLKNNIHQYGALYTSIQLLKKVTNEEFNPKYYVDYLIKKFSSLYKIKI